MSVYYMNEAAFDLPAAPYVDRTVNHVEARAPSGLDVELIVERKPFPPGRTLREVVADLTRSGKKVMRGFTVLFEREREVAGAPAIEQAVRWRDDADVIYARQVHLAVGPTWLVIVGQAEMTDREACDAYLDRVLDTFRLRE
jgi:hypothetical protein